MEVSSQRENQYTDANGKYKFCGLTPGDYSIEIDRNSLENGYFLGTKNLGDDVEKDSDINPFSGNKVIQ